MQNLVFCYNHPNLRGAASHLTQRGDYPNRTDTVDVIERAVLAQTVKRFELAYRGKPLTVPLLSTGELHGGVLWRGVACTFSPAGMGNWTRHQTDYAILEGSSVAEVSVTWHLTPGEQSENTVDTQILEDLIASVESAVTSADKGDSLERLAKYVFSGVPGFTLWRQNERTATEEIDLVFENSADSLFPHDRQYVLVECKNWSEKCGKNEAVLFRDKVQNRRGRSSLGFLLSWNGWTRTAEIDGVRHSSGNIAIGFLSGEDIKRMRRDGLAAVLKQAVSDDVFR